MSKNPALVVYSRRGCPACEDMIAELEFTAFGQSIELTVVDVDSDPELAKQYGWHVPVLMLDDSEVCRHSLDLAKLHEHLSKPG